MKNTILNIKLTFTEPTLATSPGNKETLAEFIASKAPGGKELLAKYMILKEKTKDTDLTLAEYMKANASIAPDVAEELSLLPELQEENVEKASTVFLKDEKGLLCLDYQLKGHIKEQVYMLVELGDIELSKWSYRRAVDLFCYISPRRCHFKKPDGSHILKPDGTWFGSEGNLQRPLRAQTMQGERVCLARSEMLNIGTTLEFQLRLLSPDSAKKKTLAVFNEDTIKTCLELGRLHGFSQWRNASFGRYTYSIN